MADEPARSEPPRSAIRTAVRVVLRNLAGYSLILVGGFLALPFVVGPGTPIILLGLSLIDWPGKRRFFRWLRSFSWFHSSEEWIRRRFGFRLPDEEGKDA